ncbi:RNA polymerase sigma factor WhiG [Geobacter sp. OR-1]|uniref:sigma-70 family RNA polymerase sigma factor n=1 Tax=Geobacter sp. OR-1 TaxID=1266765 RepID=UPI0005430919|nr:FliA/WhiG family RNA polymerase sigma factor [Geobacter sp. OR-1]GAM09286.1 RNA polymerase sigma factor WhiG [Geobacter sp. OR-1]
MTQETSDNPEAGNQVRDELIVAHLNHARRIARKIAAHLPPHLDRDDLMSAAVIGLIMAANRFDPTRGVQFISFAEQRIRGTILDELRAQDWLTRSLREKFKLLETKFAELEHQLGRDPASDEVAESMGMSLEDYFCLLDDVRYLSVVSLDNSWEDNEGATFGLLDLIEDVSNDGPHDQIVRRQTADRLQEAIGELPDKEKEIVSRYYYEDKSLKEIGKVMNLKESRICQLHGQAILRLRVKLRLLR